jgi:hypothetical protein
MAISLRPEFVADFVAAHSLAGPIEGEPYARLRRVLVSEENGARLGRRWNAMPIGVLSLRRCTQPI